MNLITLKRIIRCECHRSIANDNLHNHPEFIGPIRVGQTSGFWRPFCHQKEKEPKRAGISNLLEPFLGMVGSWKERTRTSWSNHGRAKCQKPRELERGNDSRGEKLRLARGHTKLSLSKEVDEDRAISESCLRRVLHVRSRHGHLANTVAWTWNGWFGHLCAEFVRFSVIQFEAVLSERKAGKDRAIINDFPHCACVTTIAHWSTWLSRCYSKFSLRSTTIPRVVSLVLLVQLW